jgi:hypothetical protein
MAFAWHSRILSVKAEREQPQPHESPLLAVGQAGGNVSTHLRIDRPNLLDDRIELGAARIARVLFDLLQVQVIPKSNITGTPLEYSE